MSIKPKNILRNQIKIKLENVAPEIRLRSSQSVAIKIMQNRKFIGSQNIACYMPIGNEIDTDVIIQAIFSQNKNCYLPAFLPPIPNRFGLVKFMAGDQLIKTKQGIMAPMVTPETIISPFNLDLVVLPLLGYNQGNFRLGRGAGYYDQVFSHRRHQPSSTQPYLLGIGYRWQKIEFDADCWDVAMDEIITPNE